ncbi:MAG: 50S ribosomal protein L14e [Candidatus Aenigmarchaeota archaeon]|nr:50S ribosomal protein L14e [Candidatus Aenigmarchaeota archaeon]
MASFEIGRVCMKIAGRETGKYCVVLKKVNDAFVEVTGPRMLTGVKRRRANVDHLEPLPFTVEIKEGSQDDEVLQALEKAGLITKFGLKRPSAAQVKTEKAKPPKEAKVEKPKEKKEEKETKDKKAKKK